MTTRSIAAAVLAAGMWLGLATTARGQVASYLDEHGKLVYVNAELPIHKTAPAKPVRQAANAAPRRTSFYVPAAAVPKGRLEWLVRDVAERNKLDPALVRAVVGAESGWNPKAISRRGAVGLMQLVPATAERFGVGNALDPAQNLDGGARYLRTLLDRYHGDLDKTLAAYNAGENAVERSGGVPNIPETRAYVRRVTDTYFGPGSGRLPGLWNAPARPIRQSVDEKGRVVFTNE